MVKIVYEAGINHGGNLKTARELCIVAKNFANYIKFQKRDINLVYTKEELDKPRVSPWGSTTREQKMGLEFGENEYNEIDEYCKKIELKWFASPWDPISVDFLAKYNPEYIKIPSALITNFELLESVKKTNVPVIISTGMSTKNEVDSCVNYLNKQLEYILACTSTYPTKDFEMNMSFIKTLKETYPKYKIGFSNHSPGTYWCTVAPAFGAEMVEYHGCLDRSGYGSDMAASIEPTGSRIIYNHIRAFEEGIGDGEWHVYESEKPLINKLRIKVYKCKN